MPILPLFVISSEDTEDLAFERVFHEVGKALALHFFVDRSKELPDLLNFVWLSGVGPATSTIGADGTSSTDVQVFLGSWQACLVIEIGLIHHSLSERRVFVLARALLTVIAIVVHVPQLGVFNSVLIIFL